MSQKSLASQAMEGLFSLSGRLNRSDFWVISIALSIAAALLTMVINLTLRNLYPEAPIWVAALIIQLIIFWPAFAVSVKRVHDRERSAMWTVWVNVAFHAVPLALLAIGQVQGAFWVYALMGVYVFIDYGVLKGSAGANKYGPSPTGPMSA